MAKQRDHSHEQMRIQREVKAVHSKGGRPSLFELKLNMIALGK